MPIYAYKCNACGHEQDVLQKMSDPVLTVCPECGQSAYAKQVTAAGFQLKGSGWYVTDFRNNGASGKPGGGAAASAPAGEGGAASGAASGGGASGDSASGGAASGGGSTGASAGAAPPAST